MNETHLFPSELVSVLTGIIKRLELTEASLDDTQDRNDGLRYYRADKDADLDFDPLTSATWESATPAATGTIDWNDKFAVPDRARAIHIWSSGTINFKAKSSTTNDSLTGSGTLAGVIPVANDGTTYWSGATGTVTVRVVGWWA